jgi:hypothetical protein
MSERDERPRLVDPDGLARYWALYSEAFAVARRRRTTLLPGREVVSDEQLRAHIRRARASRPGCHCNAEHVVATVLHRLVCTGPRWHRLWTEVLAIEAAEAERSQGRAELLCTGMLPPEGHAAWVVPDEDAETVTTSSEAVPGVLRGLIVEQDIDTHPDERSSDGTSV